MDYRFCAAIALGGLAVAACGDPTTNDPTAPSVETGAGLQDLGLAAASNTWSLRARMPAARKYASAARVGSVIYVIGGTTGNITFTTNVQAYNVTTNTWSVKRPLPSAQAFGNGASVINGKIYVAGGYFDSSLFVYDPSTNTWTAQQNYTSIDGVNVTYGVVAGSFTGVTGAFRGLWVETQKRRALIDHLLGDHYSPDTVRELMHLGPNDPAPVPPPLPAAAEKKAPETK